MRRGLCLCGTRMTGPHEGDLAVSVWKKMSNERSGAMGSVLIVEDDVLILMDTLSVFRDAGLDVVGAPSADAAISILESRPDISVVVTDVEMPGSMNGILLAAQVRERWPPVQLIVVSGYRRIDPREMPPGTQFFSKPYDVAALSMIVLTLARGTLH